MTPPPDGEEPRSWDMLVGALIAYASTFLAWALWHLIIQAPIIRDLLPF